MTEDIKKALEIEDKWFHRGYECGKDDMQEKNDRLREVLTFVYEECDWQEGQHTGDDRIGLACFKALKGSLKNEV